MARPLGGGWRQRRQVLAHAQVQEDLPPSGTSAMPARAMRSGIQPEMSSPAKRIAPPRMPTRAQPADGAQRTALAHAVATEQCRHLALRDGSSIPNSTWLCHRRLQTGDVEQAHASSPDRRGALPAGPALRPGPRAEAPADQHRQTVGQPENGIHVVLDEQDRHVPRQLLDQRHHALGLSGPVPAIGSSSSRLGFRRQRQHHFQLPLLAVRQAAGSVRSRPPSRPR